MAKTRSYASWMELYQNALFEDDSIALHARLEAAQQAIQQRARELWHADSDGKEIDYRERHELETALYFLKLLRRFGAQANAIHSS